MSNEILAAKLTELAAAISQADAWMKKAEELKKSIPAEFPEVRGTTSESLGGIKIAFGTGSARALNEAAMKERYPAEYQILKDRKVQDAIRQIKIGVTDAEKVLSKDQQADVIEIIKTAVTVRVR